MQWDLKKRNSGRHDKEGVKLRSQITVMSMTPQPSPGRRIPVAILFVAYLPYFHSNYHDWRKID
jgi:hypothetical protein